MNLEINDIPERILKEMISFFDSSDKDFKQFNIIMDALDVVKEHKIRKVKIQKIIDHLDRD